MKVQVSLIISTINRNQLKRKPAFCSPAKLNVIEKFLLKKENNNSWLINVKG